MTREQREKISNRLVLNFGILLAGALILLYVNSALQSNSAATTAMYNIVLPAVAIISLAIGLFLFFWGKAKKNAAKNYSAVCLGTLLASVILYLPKFGWIPDFNSKIAVIAVYTLMVVYFVVMAIVTAVMLRKPVQKTPIHHKKRK